MSGPACLEATASPGKLYVKRINEGFDLMHRGESIRTVVEA